jgi:hypothetical protein
VTHKYTFNSSKVRFYSITKLSTNITGKSEITVEQIKEKHLNVDFWMPATSTSSDPASGTEYRPPQTETYPPPKFQVVSRPPMSPLYSARWPAPPMRDSVVLPRLSRAVRVNGLATLANTAPYVAALATPTRRPTPLPRSLNGCFRATEETATSAG